MNIFLWFYGGVYGADEKSRAFEMPLCSAWQLGWCRLNNPPKRSTTKTHLWSEKNLYSLWPKTIQNQEHIDLYYIIHGKQLENLWKPRMFSLHIPKRSDIRLCQAAHSSGGEGHKTSGKFSVLCINDHDSGTDSLEVPIPYIRPIFQAYVREYPNKIWPEIWY